MSIRVGICSNSFEEVKYIRDVFTDAFAGQKSACMIDYFNSGKSIKEAIDSSMNYDIIFLNMDISGMGSIDMTAYIAERFPLINLILISGQNDLVYEAIKFRPFRFIRKEYLKDEIKEAVYAVICKVVDETIIRNDEHRHVSVKMRLVDVDYIESKGHYLDFHSGDKDVQIRGRISDFEDRLSNYGFIRVHRGYLANVRCIYSISSKQISLDNGEILPISRKNADAIKTQYVNYARRFMRIIDW